MIWSLTPLVVFGVVFFLAQRMNLGNFPTDGNGSVRVPEGIFEGYSYFLTAVLLVVIPLGIVATLANFELAKYKDSKSWHGLLSRDVWVSIQVFTGFITFFILITIQVLKS